MKPLGFSSSSVDIGSRAGPVIKYHHKALKDITEIQEC